MLQHTQVLDLFLIANHSLKGLPRLELFHLGLPSRGSLLMGCGLFDEKLPMGYADATMNPKKQFSSFAIFFIRVS